MYVQDHHSYYTIRCSACVLLLPHSNSPHPNSRCDPCRSYRKVLNTMLSRLQHNDGCSGDSLDPGSHTNYRFLNTPEKKARIQQLRKKVNKCQLQIKRLREKIEKLVDERGVEVDRALHGDLASTMEDSAAEIVAQYPQGSFARIFWEQHYESLKVKDARRMRWEPAMIRLVIHSVFV